MCVVLSPSLCFTHCGFRLFVSRFSVCSSPSGGSLQYAFIEFENAESCAEAFKKMENVLIDDRRIHGMRLSVCVRLCVRACVCVYVCVSSLWRWIVERKCGQLSSVIVSSSPP
jgi:hypothetical protein